MGKIFTLILPSNGNQFGVHPQRNAMFWEQSSKAALATRNLFIGGRGASPAHGQHALEALAGVDAKVRMPRAQG